MSETTGKRFGRFIELALARSTMWAQEQVSLRVWIIYAGAMALIVVSLVLPLLAAVIAALGLIAGVAVAINQAVKTMNKP